MVKKKVVKKVAKIVPEARTVRGILNIIDRFLVTAKGDAPEDLWNILSALRGPDLDHSPTKIKSSTTIPIRRRAFPQFTRRWDSNSHGHCPHVGASFGEPEGKFTLAGSSGHFRAHADDAWFSLKKITKKGSK